MVTMYVTYDGDAGTKFDRGHWINWDWDYPGFDTANA